MVKINNILLKYGHEVSGNVNNRVLQEPVKQTVVEISKIASDCISNVQRGVIETSRSLPKLNRCSANCDYFGVYSAEGIQRRLDNQMTLTWLKTKDENLVNFPPIIMDNTYLMKDVQKSLNELKERGFGRLTITDKLFGENGQDGTHTIGMVYHKGKYIILDSLSESYPEIKDIHSRLVKFLGIDSNEVIYSNKAQQTKAEFTCNNWTHANLDAAINYLKDDGVNKELTVEVLDKILPEDINRVLAQQVDYTFDKLKGKSLFEVIAECS